VRDAALLLWEQERYIAYGTTRGTVEKEATLCLWASVGCFFQYQYIINGLFNPIVQFCYDMSYYSAQCCYLMKETRKENYPTPISARGCNTVRLNLIGNKFLFNLILSDMIIQTKESKERTIN
jgi:hypothetical protein